MVKEKEAELIRDTRVKYDATINTFQTLTYTFYDNQSKFLASKMASVIDSNETYKGHIREEILDKLNYFYLNEKLRNMEVFHIFEKNGKSFLRFHKRDKYGDSISSKRFSLRNIMDKKISQSGLELGVWKESFRFQYPLFYNGDFVGMFEYGISFEEIMNEMQNVLSGNYHYIINKNLVDAIMSPSVTSSRYATSFLNPNFYVVKTTHENTLKCEILQSLSKKSNLKQKTSSMDKAFVIAFSSNHQEYSATFLPIKDINGVQAAFYISFEEGNYLASLYFTLFTIYLLLTIIILGILYNFYKSRKDQEFTSTLLNSQQDMIFLTNGMELQTLNNPVLEFFNYKDIKALKREHQCICDFFLEGDDYLQKTKNSVSWLDYLLKHPEYTHKVKLYCYKTREDKIFHLKFTQFPDTNNFIITLSDITKDELLRDKLNYKANHDSLTKIYNRTYFNNYLEKVLSNAQRYQSNFSLIMFDIDHFKSVNDTYGHDIGDIVLIEMASLVKGQIRKGDVFARWGGEEFMIVVMDSLENVEVFANILREKIANHEFSEVGQITCSFGLSMFEESDIFATITKRADEMLYIAKSSGRNIVVAKGE
ncbi:MAG: diguanylate cyclase [Campylobacterota bacterium]|nr:diguanylate cyclase [Campylobacterota bacterium]